MKHQRRSWLPSVRLVARPCGTWPMTKCIKLLLVRSPGCRWATKLCPAAFTDRGISRGMERCGYTSSTALPDRLGRPTTLTWVTLQAHSRFHAVTSSPSLRSSASSLMVASMVSPAASASISASVRSDHERTTRSSFRSTRSPVIFPMSSSADLTCARFAVCFARMSRSTASLRSHGLSGLLGS